jgi:hypothetical protein
MDKQVTTAHQTWWGRVILQIAQQIGINPMLGADR